MESQNELFTSMMLANGVIDQMQAYYFKQTHENNGLIFEL